MGTAMYILIGFCIVFLVWLSIISIELSKARERIVFLTFLLGNKEALNMLQEDMDNNENIPHVIVVQDKNKE